MQNKHSIKQVNDWNKFKSFLDKLSNNWIFRGQSNSNWDLCTSLERTDFFHAREYIEIEFLSDFKRGACNYLAKEDMPESLIEWLALMQHHGAPTRLLDFTKSPFIAAYFAFENTNNKDESVAIWAVNIDILYDKMMEYLELKHSDEYEKIRSQYRDEDFANTKRQFTDQDFVDIFYQNSKSCIIPIEPFKMNRRYSLQQSIFLSSGNSYQPFMEQLDFIGSVLEKTVIKFCFPISLRKEILRDLQKMNINRTTLFPDLDGYSVGLKVRYNIALSGRECFEKQIKLLKNNKFKYFP